MKTLQCLVSYGDIIQYNNIVLTVKEYIPAKRKIKLVQQINKTSSISTYMTVRALNDNIKKGNFIILPKKEY